MEPAVVVVIGTDRPGIVAGISSKLAERNVNIVDISQTVLRGLFSMIMIVDMSKSTVSLGKLREELQQRGKELGVEVLVYHGEVFQFMERI
ncbi:MAG: ACT domain-containing protein [Candidatus Aramenus sp.]|nr:ACT domain-containing protein [Candidatus Aramenus sp.]